MFARSTSSSICLRCLARRTYSTTPTNSSSELASSATLPPPPPPPPPASGAAKLTNRRLIALHGRDTPHFLQGLVTANIRPGHTNGLYGAFLNAQGRVLNDVFIYPTAHSKPYTSSLPGTLSRDDPAYIIEVDASQAPKLLAHLRRHKLRSKLTISLLEPGEWDVWSLWREDERWTPHYADESPLLHTPHDSRHVHDGGHVPDSSGTATATTHPHHPPHAYSHDEYDISSSVLSTVDARAPGMGRRVLTRNNTHPPALDEAGIPQTSLAAYTVRRMLRGVPEGQAEILRESALPLESNIDFMGGVDFRKGCYVGQELTIRTHHTGVVRKRILPVLLYDPAQSSIGHEETPSQQGQLQLHYDPQALQGINGLQGIQGIQGAQGADGNPMAVAVPPGTNILKATNATRARGSAGKFLAGIGNIGLALCRLEVMTDLALTGEGSKWTPGDEFVMRWADSSAGGSSNGAAASGGEEQVKVKAFIPGWHKHKGTIDVREQR
ncbi:Aminomethyltransferase folate-binding domain-containing protein [Xylona heveae TC161]|uniref:Iron-sulfur cluster assembly factor IBA57 homolog, mitochondrial n=1 Tax=Xylona heveae (strain CBS 132557 / TC161) TaxID=1328760 RepID=A0A165JV98_XYLHT|nr:Aminomethyltransferase folate-binding domain-containing protein [Xylona heveae TC161]KZF26677.1 Aminomethyltransferase folate-binding domain-containing protein [Xylona heveae TC161]